MDTISLFPDKFNVVCISELWLTETHIEVINIYGYYLTNKYCRKNNIHGVRIYVKVGIQSDPFPLANLNEEFNAEFCAIKLFNTNIYFVSTYRSCTGNFESQEI